LVGLLSEADRALGALSSLAAAAPDGVSPLRLLVSPLLSLEAVLSSRIEGTRTTVEEFLSAQVPPVPELSPDTREVNNYLEASEHGLALLATRPLDLALLCELHGLLLAGVRGAESSPGCFRRTQAYIAAPGRSLRQATYVPPPPAEIARLLGDLEPFLARSPELPPLIQCALVHAQFEMIHPFADGNGRIGRLLMALMLSAWGQLPEPLLCLSAYFERRRADYYAGLLGVSARGDWDAWLRFFLQAAAVQARRSAEAWREITALREELRDRLRAAGAGRQAVAVLDLLFDNPFITVRATSQRLGVTAPTAGAALHDLLRAGILEEITGKQRNQRFLARRILEALEQAADTD
jgi:Fic family protein